jgi:lipoprotein-anchoring transpeptidase ErfK/SrfK
MRLRYASLVLALPLLAACGTTRAAEHGVLAARKQTCAARAARSLRTPARAYAAVVTAHAEASRRPGGPAFARFGRLNVNGVANVFGVLSERVDASCRATWYRVQLPLRPNGVTGWVPAREVAVLPVATRIEVDLSAHRVTFFRNGRRVLSATAAIGSPATPTPVGNYYVNQRLIPNDPRGPFGPGAIGISAFSNVLTGWAQGGPIAIHGTNEPWSIGRSVSNGCIRLPNDVLRRLFWATPAGTPVTIHA